MWPDWEAALACCIRTTVCAMKMKWGNVLVEIELTLSPAFAMIQVQADAICISIIAEGDD